MIKKQDYNKNNFCSNAQVVFVSKEYLKYSSINIFDCFLTVRYLYNRRIEQFNTEHQLRIPCFCYHSRQSSAILRRNSYIHNRSGWYSGSICRQGNSYPNQVKQVATLAIDGINTAAQVFITDLTGRIVKTYNYASSEKQLEMNVSNFANGTYLVKIITEKGYSIQKLVVKKQVLSGKRRKGKSQKIFLPFLLFSF